MCTISRNVSSIYISADATVDDQYGDLRRVDITEFYILDLFFLLVQ